MTNYNAEQCYKNKLENILATLINDFPEDISFKELFGDYLTATRLTQSIQLYQKIAKIHYELQKEKQEHVPEDEKEIKEALIKKIKKFITT